MRFQRQYFATREGFYNLVNDFTWEHVAGLPPTKLIKVLWKLEFLLISFEWKEGGITLIALKTIPVDGDWAQRGANVMVDAHDDAGTFEPEKERLAEEFLKALIEHLDQRLKGLGNQGEAHVANHPNAETGPAKRTEND